PTSRQLATEAELAKHSSRNEITQPPSVKANPKHGGDYSDETQIEAKTIQHLNSHYLFQSCPGKRFPY
ncbi:MAG: hypothetical protein WBE33_16720, partial [Planococcus citreus]